jgi:hypothetical protein
MWLAQFVCAPQFFKTPKGLCGHTVQSQRFSKDTIKMLNAINFSKCYKIWNDLTILQTCLSQRQMTSWRLVMPQLRKGQRLTQLRVYHVLLDESFITACYRRGPYCNRSSSSLQRVAKVGTGLMKESVRLMLALRGLIKDRLSFVFGYFFQVIAELISLHDIGKS